MNLYLSDLSTGKDNNLNLIRFTLAFFVLLSHSFALVYGGSYVENNIKSLHIAMGGIAVDMFFIISGFLIAKSYIYSKSVKQYIKARALRIYPAAIAMTIFCIILGAIYTTTSLKNYFINLDTFKFLINNSILLFGIEHNLPHVFTSNPFPNEVNGSLWTLRYEIKMYAIIAVMYSALLYLSKKISFVKVKETILIFTIGIVLFHILNNQFNIITSNYPRLLSMFFMGASFFLWSDRIKLSTSLFLLCVTILFISSFEQNLYFIAYCITLPLILFYLAYIPKGIIRKYNNIGDYSYGFYIYAFPVQQAVVATNPNISVTFMILVSFSITFLLSVLSWHFIESKFLKKKEPKYLNKNKAEAQLSPANNN